MRRLFILRPEPGATASAERARELGLEPVVTPLFEVEPVDWDAPEAASFDGLLLTSANAVRHGGEDLGALRGLRTYAVGEATAEAAREAGFDIASTGDAGLERLLGSIEADLKLLHLCGEQRTEAEARQQITPIVVYRSRELPIPDDLRELGGQAAAVHSPRAGRRLAEATEQLGIDRSTVRLAGISKAAAEATGEGWERCEAAETMDDSALLALAARLCDKPDPE